MWQFGKLGVFSLAAQAILLILFIRFVYYDPEADAGYHWHSKSYFYGGMKKEENSVNFYYPLFQDVHVMIFVGFAFLMTFLKNYGYSALGLNLFLAAIAVQYALLFQNFWDMENRRLYLNIKCLIRADCAAAAVLISFGAILGKTSALQLLVMTILEVFLFACNERLGNTVLQANDVGGSMFLHAFGAYFGLGVSFMIKHDYEDQDRGKEKSVYRSDIFAMIGTLFLWMFWPSFNAALSEGDDKHRIVLNTCLALTSSCVAAFAVSSIIDKRSKLSMVHIQNATLAGGVAIGTSADMMTQLYGAMIIGALGGILSVLGYIFITPFLHRKIKVHDTCGVHNLHGMPGILAGIAGAIFSLLASKERYGYRLYEMFPARAPYTNTTELDEILLKISNVSGGVERTAAQQAGYQLAALFHSLVISLAGGLLVGKLISYPFFKPVKTDKHFDDQVLWNLPEAEDVFLLELKQRDKAGNADLLN